MAVQTPEHRNCNISETRQDRAKVTTGCIYKCIDWCQNSTILNDLKALFEVSVADLRDIRFVICCILFLAAMLTAIKSIKQNKQLPAHSASIEIYSGIARFLC